MSVGKTIKSSAPASAKPYRRPKCPQTYHQEHISAQVRSPPGDQRDPSNYGHRTGRAVVRTTQRAELAWATPWGHGCISLHRDAMVSKPSSLLGAFNNDENKSHLAGF